MISGVPWTDGLPPACSDGVREVDPKLHRTRVGKRVMPSDGMANFEAYAHLVNVDPDKNRYRFYTLSWQPSLFGGLALVRSWGRIGTSGRSRAIFFADQEGAQKAVEEIMKRRMAHGYRVVQWE